MSLIPLKIRQGLHPAHLQNAALLYCEAFRRQIGPIAGVNARAVNFLRQLINPTSAISAYHDGQIVGLIGLQYGDQRFIQLRLPIFIASFGWLLGRLRYQQASLLEQTAETGQLRIEGIAVAPQLRGQGVGTWLINAAVDFASQHGLESVQINVPDTALALKSLCRRLGFNPVAPQNSPFLAQFGIRSFTPHIKSV